jgi:hypothetical protein
MAEAAANHANSCLPLYGVENNNMLIPADKLPVLLAISPTFFQIIENPIYLRCKKSGSVNYLTII